MHNVASMKVCDPFKNLCDEFGGIAFAYVVFLWDVFKELSTFYSVFVFGDFFLIFELKVFKFMSHCYCRT